MKIVFITVKNQKSSESEMRNEFRSIKQQESFYLYPLPVIKGNKYLIETKFPDFFIDSLAKGYLDSPDINKSFLIEEKIHNDGKTPIYSINIEKLHFKFLTKREDDLIKAKGIEKVLTEKIKSVLKGALDSKEDLHHRFQKQLLCSTCQSLGINSSDISKWLSKL